ncbi:MAG: HlyD family efflux transporter periplasmic adaptor subunit [Hyphomicrobiales bacterium]|nr:HlyD family efflux transporter periplasmic adaptor subunit [Hyphomicrobiales bacterium]
MADHPDEKNLPLVESGAAHMVGGKSSKTSGRSRLYLIPMAMLVLFIGAVIGMYFQPPGLKVFFNLTGLQPGGGTTAPIASPVNTTITKEDVAALDAGALVALGRLVPKGDVITVALPFSSSDTRVETLPVSVGQWVEAGGVLATLDNRVNLEAAVDAAAAEVAVMEAIANQTRLSVAASQAEAEAALKRAETEAEVAKTEQLRSKSLFDRGVATQAVLDRSNSAFRKAEQEVLKLRATVARFRAGTSLTQADILLAERRQDAAQVALTAARTNLEKAVLRAPSGGTVLEIHARPGERPGAKGVVDFGNTRQMTAEVEIYQNQVSRISLGDPVRLRAEAFPQTLQGRVVEIGLEVGRQSIIDRDPAANTDARVVSVTVELDVSSSVVAGRFINLEVLAWFHAGDKE